MGKLKGRGLVRVTVRVGVMGNVETAQSVL